MNDLFRDFIFALRQWRKYPLSNLTAILILVIGIGANTANFSLINALLLRPLPFPEPDQLVHLYTTDPYGQFDIGSFSMQAFLDLKEKNDVFEELGGYYYSAFGLSSDQGSPERTTVSSISVNMLPMLGVSPFLGRGFTEDEAVEGQNQVVLLSEGLWRQRYGGSEDVIGQTLKLDGEEYTILGVMPADFVFPFNGVKVWRPMKTGYDLYPRTSEFVQLVGRLQPGVSSDQALAQSDRLYRQLEEAATGETAESGIRIVALRKALTFLFDVMRPLLHVATAAYFFVLLIICANVASLMLVRSSERTQETALRRALGANRWRILRQFLTEGVLLALVGGALGAAAAHFAVKILAKAIPDQLFRVGEITVDTTALLFTLLVAIVTSVVFTLKPALQSTKASLAGSLKRSSTAPAGGRGSRRLHDFIVIGEIALAVILLAGTSLLVQSFLFMKNLDPGFNPEQVLTFEMDLPSSEYADDEAVRAFYGQLTREMEGLPGVVAATSIFPLPLNWETSTQEFFRPGGDSLKDRSREQAVQHAVGANFFSAMEIDLLEGRTFSPVDNADGQPVLMINSTLAKRYWPDESPVGQQLRLAPGDTQATIIGVVEDSKSFLMNEKPRSMIYRSQEQEAKARNFIAVRTSGDPETMISGAREVARRLDPNLPLNDIRPLATVVDNSLSPFESSARVLGGLTVIAFVLSGLGLWGVVAYTVSQGTRELSIRQALGAERTDLLRLVLRHSLTLTVSGVAIGLLISAASSYFLSSMLFGVSRFDPLTLVGIVVLMALLALAATLFPARKAIRVEPAIALRSS